MSCHCDLGMSARAIAYAGHDDHPHDPADLRRCIDYCRRQGITPSALRERMAGRSSEWDALLPHWGELVGLLEDETDTRTDGCAPATYARMRALLYPSREGI